MMLMVWFFHSQVVAALLLHPVHGGRALVDLTDLVVDARVEQDPLGGRGLARVDVRHDPDVADLGEIEARLGRHAAVLRRLVGEGTDYQR